MNEPKFRSEMHKTLRMQSFAAEAREFRVDRVVPRGLIEKGPGIGLNAEISSYVEQETNNMIVALHTHILGLDGEVELLMVSHEDVPLTWYDHFKSRFFEEWALRGRWPLKPIGRYIKNRWPDNKRAHLEWMLRKDEQ